MSKSAARRTARLRIALWSAALLFSLGPRVPVTLAQGFASCPAAHDVRVAFPPSAPNGGSCIGGATPSNYVRASAEVPPLQSEELHVIGVYEAQLPDHAARGPGQHPQGVVSVVVHARPRPIALFLSAYEPVRWELRLDDGVRLSRIVTQGYYAQEVIGAPSATPIESRDRTQTCAYAYGWEVAANSGGGSYLDMIASVRASTGLTEKSFQGCYGGVAFEVPFRDEPAPDSTPVVPGNEALDRADVDVPACRAVLRERGGYCLTQTDGALELVGLDSGTMCPVVRTSSSTKTPDQASIAWRGEIVYVCGQGGLTRISLRDGSEEALGLPCQAVTDFADGILLQPPLVDFRSQGYRWYASLESILDDRVDEILPQVQRNSRMTAEGPLVFSAWHSTGSVDVADVVRGVARKPIALEGYDGWILGLATTGDGRLVVSGDRWGQTLFVFDLATGRRLRTLALPRAATGLSCVSALARHRTSPSVGCPRLAILR